MEESTSSYGPYGYVINNKNDINKRKRQDDVSEYDDDESDYEQDPRQLRATTIRPVRPLGRPKGSKNKPKTVPVQFDHNNQQINELPKHVPSLVLSSYTSTGGETFDYD